MTRPVQSFAGLLVLMLTLALACGPRALAQASLHDRAAVRDYVKRAKKK